MTAFPYESASAFNAALKQRLQEASDKGNYSVQELRRQFAYDRLLVRAFTFAPDRWILKGGGGLLARVPGQARHSMDIDLFYLGELETAVSELQQVGVDDSIGDFFTFDILPSPQEFANGAVGMNLTVAAFLGEREFQRFNIDLVVSSNMTQEPDFVTGLAPVLVPGLNVVDYVVYPLVDHVADKHAAMIDTYGEGERPSSRYRDLVDLVLIATTNRIDALELRRALLSEYVHRGLSVPTGVESPSDAWGEGYALEAAKVPHLQQRNLEQALDH